MYTIYLIPDIENGLVPGFLLRSKTYKMYPLEQSQTSIVEDGTTNYNI